MKETPGSVLTKESPKLIRIRLVKQGRTTAWVMSCSCGEKSPFGTKTNAARAAVAHAEVHDRHVQIQLPT